MIQPEHNDLDGSEQTLVDLGTQPLVNNLCKTKEEALSAKRYPLKATINNKLIIKLNTAIPPDKLYKNYLYHSGVSKPYINHCYLLWHQLKHLKHNTIIDVGGNDGTLLKAFQSQTKDKLRLINVDASTSFLEENRIANIEYVNEYFNADLTLPKADLIISTNVFQHTSDVHKFVKGIKKHLDGVWILEFPYTLNTLKTLQFDQFYHEHYYYWLVSPLQKLFEEYGLHIFNAEELSIHGGTMRLWITNKESYANTHAHLKFIKQEQAFDFSRCYSDLNIKILQDKCFLNNLEGETAYFGAAAKGCVYLNALGITANTKPKAYVVDDTTSKQNLYVPGTGMPIKDRDYLYKNQPNNLIILAHNFKDYIIKSLRPQYKGRIITMFPTIEINMYNDHTNNLE
jgi:2-polyprenyl-3-methyl-5-hydroxy-6-metoxy-1,4-benzoquinol methylase